MANLDATTALTFAVALANSLNKSLGTVLGAAPGLKVQEGGESAAATGKQMHLRIVAEGGLRGECVLELPESQAAELGAKAAGVAAAGFGEPQAEALRKAVEAAMPEFAASLALQHGEVSFKVERLLEQTFDRSQVFHLASPSGQPAVTLSLYLDSRITEALSPKKAGGAAAIDQDQLDAMNMKLVMDVELNVSLRFGQRQLALREVLELSNGSVVELDCRVDEPIDLLLDGKVIARGEAVIVDGNYGLRVTEVPQPVASHLLQ